MAGRCARQPRQPGLARLTNPVTGGPGVRVRFLDADSARRAECFPHGRSQPATPEASAMMWGFRAAGDVGRELVDVSDCCRCQRLAG
jgi:hypothetical protein